jgi:hypothetical protein
MAASPHLPFSQLAVGDQCHQFADTEIWVSTNYDPGVSSVGWWDEEGATHGVHADGSCGNGYQWFWAAALAPMRVAI